MYAVKNFLDGIIDKHYPAKTIPKWVNKDNFRKDMYDRLYESLEDALKANRSYMDFGSIAFPFVSEYVDTCASSILNDAEHEENFRVEIPKTILSKEVKTSTKVAKKKVSSKSSKKAASKSSGKVAKKKVSAKLRVPQIIPAGEGALYEVLKVKYADKKKAGSKAKFVEDIKRVVDAVRATKITKLYPEGYGGDPNEEYDRIMSMPEHLRLASYFLKVGDDRDLDLRVDIDDFIQSQIAVPPNEKKLKAQIMKAFKEQIKLELMDKYIMQDRGQKPYTAKQVQAYIKNIQKKLEEAANKMYEDYKNDGELDDLKTAERDWYIEYLEDIHV